MGRQPGWRLPPISPVPKSWGTETWQIFSTVQKQPPWRQRLELSFRPVKLAGAETSSAAFLGAGSHQQIAPRRAGLGALWVCAGVLCSRGSRLQGPRCPMVHSEHLSLWGTLLWCWSKCTPNWTMCMWTHHLSLNVSDCLTCYQALLRDTSVTTLWKVPERPVFCACQLKCQFFWHSVTKTHKFLQEEWFL